MNERLVTQQETNEHQEREVHELRQQVQEMERVSRRHSLLTRSLHINIQAAMDHLVVSSKLLTDDRALPADGEYEYEDDENEEDNPIYSIINPTPFHPSYF